MQRRLPIASTTSSWSRWNERPGSSTSEVETTGTSQSSARPARIIDNLFTSAIIAAGGRGQRFGGAVPKQLLTVDGRPILERSVALFVGHPAVDEIIVALPPELAEDPPSYLVANRKPIRVVRGGMRRQDSVANAFAAVDARCELVVIHDAARPFATAELVSRTIAAAAESGAALAAIRARDTVKRVEGPAEVGRHDGSFVTVTETIPRETIYLAQTPQAFQRRVLRDALALAEPDTEATDEAALAERTGHHVRIVEGESSNIKITTPDDVPAAELIARSGQKKPARTGRAGTGYDLHRLVPGRRLMIGGIEIPSDRGPLGHSDGDVVCHAVVDAMLGAVGLGDIGRHFPDNDPRWKDAPGLDLLARAVELVGAQGYEVGNVDVTVLLEAPRIKAFVDPMRAAMAGTLGIALDRVSIKGKTNEGVDAVGRGEAIAAHAIALLRQK
jgi:2-C-methyl-D-erythritol 4-phosphate cytidylyltransferase / 2-C-methyl-D-erythritol 2,4-cyclodiphosphate synthase